MKITNGTDIIEIKRIKENIEANGEKFLNRVYTTKEIEYCESKNVQKYQSYAARFAAKEAIFKALSEYIPNDYCWKDFEIVNDSNGRPYVKLQFKMEKLKNIDVSISHCKEYAISNVTAIIDEEN